MTRSHCFFIMSLWRRRYFSLHNERHFYNFSKKSVHSGQWHLSKMDIGLKGRFETKICWLSKKHILILFLFSDFFDPFFHKISSKQNMFEQKVFSWNFFFCPVSSSKRRTFLFQWRTVRTFWGGFEFSDNETFCRN